jgi:quinol monooxygenase YgiN
MRRVLVRYTVKPERVAENEELVRAVYAELAETDPGGLRYATFKLEDGVTFVHIATEEDGSRALAECAAFQRFQAGVRDRCDEPPVVTELEPIGAYGA